MKHHLTILLGSVFLLSACQDKQAELEQQLQAQQEQIAQLQEQLADETVYQLTASAVEETLSPEAQEQGKNGEPVTGTDGQQYVYDASTGSWFLQSLVGAAAGAFIGNALASKFTKAPQNSAFANQVRSQYSQQYKGKSPTAPSSLSAKPNNTQPKYRPAQQNISNKPVKRRMRGFGRRR